MNDPVLAPLEIARVQSKPGATIYVMHRYPSGWTHYGGACEWEERRREDQHACKHVELLEKGDRSMVIPDDDVPPIEEAPPPDALDEAEYPAVGAFETDDEREDREAMEAEPTDVDHDDAISAPIPPIQNNEDTSRQFSPSAIPAHALVRSTGPANPPTAVALRRADMSTLIDDFDAQLIVAGVSDEIKENWAYSFRGSDGKTTTGISINGIPHAVREMAKRGEVIRLNRVAVVYEDETEIRLEAMATRYAVTGDGSLVPLDTSVRAKRRKKTMTINDWEGEGQQRRKIGTHEDPDPFWWEKAYSMVVRNATLPLIRQDVKSVIIAASLDAKRALAGSSGGRGAPTNRQVGTGQQRTLPAAGANRGRPTQARQPSRPAQGATQAASPGVNALLTQLRSKMGPAYGDYYRGLLANYPGAADGTAFRPERLPTDIQAAIVADIQARLK